MNSSKRGASVGDGMLGIDCGIKVFSPRWPIARCFCTLVFWVTGTVVVAQPVRLTNDGSLKRDPVFVDGGREIVYCYDETPALVRMAKYSMEDRVAKPMFEDAADKHHLEPAFSLDGKWISFTACTGNLSGKLVIRNLESGKQADITHKGRGGTRSPVFSPDNQRVVYAFAEEGPQQLWSVKTDGTDKQQLTTCLGISNWPSFTPDGQSIVFANSRENNYEIYSVSPGGATKVD